MSRTNLNFLAFSYLIAKHGFAYKNAVYFGALLSFVSLHFSSFTLDFANRPSTTKSSFGSLRRFT